MELPPPPNTTEARVHRTYSFSMNAPNWLARAVLLTIGAGVFVLAMIVFIPLALVMLGALALFGLVIFAKIMVGRMLGGRSRGSMPGRRASGEAVEGRENVRVIRRDD